MKSFKPLFLAALVPMCVAAQSSDPPSTAGRSLNVLVLGQSKFSSPLSAVGRVEFSPAEVGSVVASGTLRVVGNGVESQTLHVSSLAGAALTFGEAILPTGLSPATQGPAATLSAWPNPTCGELTLGGVADGEAVSVLDLCGRVVLRGRAPSLNLSPLPAGVYVVSVGGRAVRVIRN